VTGTWVKSWRDGGGFHVCRCHVDVDDAGQAEIIGAERCPCAGDGPCLMCLEADPEDTLETVVTHLKRLDA